MLVSRLIMIWFILLDSCHMAFMHEIEENYRLKNNSLESIIVRTDTRATPRQGGIGNQGGFGGLSYLAVSLLFQLPLMEIIFVMGLIILVLGIMLHFVELKADFFRLRRQFLREQRLRIQLEREEALRNITLALQGSNSSFINGLNGNPVNGLFNQNFGSEVSQSHGSHGNHGIHGNHENYGNNGDYGQHYSGDKLYAQSSQSYPSRQLPPNSYLQSKKLLRRRIVNQFKRTDINSQIPQNINKQKLFRRRYPPQRVVAFNKRRGLPNFRRRVGKK